MRDNLLYGLKIKIIQLESIEVRKKAEEMEISINLHRPQLSVCKCQRTIQWNVDELVDDRILSNVQSVS